MLEIGISPKNAAAVKQAAAIEPAPNCHGYTSAIFATVGSHRYKLETLNGPRPLYVLTAQEAPGVCNYVVLCFEDYTPEKISIRKADIFKNAASIPTRKETAPRLLKKYSQLAALVHGLITNGATTGPDAAALILAERAAEAPKKAAEPATDTRPAADPEKAAEKAHRGPKKCYNVNIYTTAEGIRRADIRTESGRPWLDIPAAELEAIRAEIETKSPGRVSFTITEEPAKDATTGAGNPYTDTEPQQPSSPAGTMKDTQKAPAAGFRYGMRCRGYSIGCQPPGVIAREDDPAGIFWDIITYPEPLTPENIRRYSLTPLDGPADPEPVQEPTEAPAAPTRDEERPPEAPAAEATAPAAIDPTTAPETISSTEPGTASPGTIDGQRRPHTGPTTPGGSAYPTNGTSNEEKPATRPRDAATSRGRPNPHSDSVFGIQPVFRQNRTNFHPIKYPV